MKNFDPITEGFEPITQQQKFDSSSEGFEPIQENQHDTSQQNALPKSSWIDRLANNPVTNTILGAGDAVRNTLSDTANLLPGINIKPVKSSEGTAYNVGNIAGNVGAFMGGGELLDAARVASKGLPYLGKLAQALEGNAWKDAAKRGIGTAIYGAVTNPDDRLKGAEEGFLSSVGGDAVLGGAGKLLGAVRPKKYAEQVMELLGGGKTLEENNKDIAQLIKSAYGKNVEVGKNLYEPVFSKLGNQKIYEEINPYSSSYKNLNKNVIDDYDPKLSQIHEDFIASPTLQNAHDLQSQLGSVIRKLESNDVKGSLSVADRKSLQRYQSAREALLSDMKNFMGSKDPNLVEQYNLATQHWSENVTPYLDNPNLAKISKGEITNPKSLSRIFKNPEPEVEKIVDEMGPTAKHKIVYSEVGKGQSKLTPEKLADALNKLEDKGLGSYVTPEIGKHLENLTGKISKRDLAQRLTGLGLGATALGSLPVLSPEIMGIAGAGIGAAGAPFLSKALNKIIPASRKNNSNINSEKFARALYQSFLANMLPGGNQ